MFGKQPQSWIRISHFKSGFHTNPSHLYLRRVNHDSSILDEPLTHGFDVIHIYSSAGIINQDGTESMLNGVHSSRA